MGEEIKNLFDAEVTSISNAFLEKYLGEANAEYLKVYIYYLWKRNKKSHYDIATIADDLNLTENDVERAIKYWVKLKVIEKCPIANDNSKNIDNSNNKEKVTTRPTNLVSFQEKKSEMQEKKDEETFKEILFFAETILPNTISNPQLQVLHEMYDEMKFSPEVIQYLIEYLAQNETYTAQYMRKIATSWFEQGIKTAKDAKTYTQKFARMKDKDSKKKKLSSKKTYEREALDYDDMLDKRAKVGKDIFR